MMYLQHILVYEKQLKKINSVFVFFIIIIYLEPCCYWLEACYVQSVTDIFCLYICAPHPLTPCAFCIHIHVHIISPYTCICVV